MLRQTVRDFVRTEVEPQAAEHDRTGHLNLPLLGRAGELGLLGITVPEEDGGAGMDATAAVIAHEELAWSDPGFTLAYLAHAILFVNNFYWAASREQRARYLPRVLSGQWVGAMAMTEPAVGTDVLGMKTIARRRKGGGYAIEGRKTFITNGPEASIFIVYAMLDGEVTAFAVERGFLGFSSGPKIPKMGMRASTMSELMFDGCEVPADNLLGREGGGVTNMMRRYIADSYARTEAMRALVYSVARRVGPDRRNRLGTDAAKLFAATAGKEVADAAMQVMGGYGYCAEYRVEQFLRDAKLIEIGGGTLEAHQKNITRDLTRAAD